MSNEAIPHEEFVIKAVGEVLARATKSAIQCGNYPLNATDVGFSFDSFVHEKMLTDSVAYVIANQLRKLGFEF